MTALLPAPFEVEAAIDVAPFEATKITVRGEGMAPMLLLSLPRVPTSLWTAQLAGLTPSASPSMDK